MMGIRSGEERVVGYCLLQRRFVLAIWTRVLILMVACIVDIILLLLFLVLSFTKRRFALDMSPSSTLVAIQPKIGLFIEFFAIDVVAIETILGFVVFQSTSVAQQYRASQCITVPSYIIRKDWLRTREK